MALSREEIKKLAHLSRLAIDEAAVDKLQVDLQRMMDLVAKVQEVDTSSFSGAFHVQTRTQPMQDDDAQDPASNLAKGAANNKEGFVVVPKVIG